MTVYSLKKLKYLVFLNFVFGLFIYVTLKAQFSSVTPTQKSSRVHNFHTLIYKIKESEKILDRLILKLTAVSKSTNTKVIELNVKQFSLPIQNGLIYPENFSYRINKLKNYCKDMKFSIFIYVHSDIKNFIRRDIIRQTWGNKSFLSKLRIGIAFITGKLTNDSSAMKALEEESITYGDIVQTDYEDSYFNISIKSTSALNWAAKYCSPYVDILIKSDDDIFINITRVVQYITNDIPKIKFIKGDKLIFCNVWENEAVIRLPTDRWYIPEELYRHKYYPPFCQGSALIITNRAASALNNALTGAPLFPLDDVLLTGFQAPVADVSLVAINSRHLASLKERNITMNDINSGFFFVHSNMPNLLKLWSLTRPSFS